MLPDKITVRQFIVDEWERYKAIRLTALQASPSVFCSSYALESAHPDQWWKDRLGNTDIGVFGVFHEDEVIGLTGVEIDRITHSPSIFTFFWGSWLEKEWRNRGISREMFSARIQWAQQHPDPTSVFVGHRDGNGASKKAIEKNGFIFTETVSEAWPDGKDDPLHIYELKL